MALISLMPLLGRGWAAWMSKHRAAFLIAYLVITMCHALLESVDIFVLSFYFKFFVLCFQFFFVLPICILRHWLLFSNEN